MTDENKPDIPGSADTETPKPTEEVQKTVEETPKPVVVAPPKPKPKPKPKAPPELSLIHI